MSGKHTSEFAQSKWVGIASVVLPTIAVLIDQLTQAGALSGTWLMIGGLISSAIASAGYSYSRGKTKSAEAVAASVIESQKKSSES
jgi:hypothetical protein